MGARLNILPQKRWNVYGRENRLKVKRDEEKAAAEQAERSAAHQKAESEYRHAALLKRAKLRTGAPDTSETAQNSQTHPDIEAQTAAQRLLEGGKAKEGGALSSAPAESLPNAKGGTNGFDVLGFLRTEPAQTSEHAETIEEKRKEARRRGNAMTQTSDPRFDAQFAFGHGLAGASNQPWYAKAQPNQEEEPAKKSPLGTVKALEAGSGSKRGREESRQQEQEARKKAKKVKKDKHKKKTKHRELKHALPEEGGKVDLMALLRKEREQREAAEREKAKVAVLDAAGRLHGGPDGKRYHSSYGSRRQGR